MATAGIKANGERLFEVRLSGKKIYGLLALLEQDALDADVYPDLVSASNFAEEIRAQVREQGFYG